MKHYQITIKGVSGSVIKYTGIFLRSGDALIDAANRITEISKIQVHPCA